MTLTQMTLMEVEINKIWSTISSGDSSSLTFFAFKFSFFWKQPSRGVVGRGVFWSYAEDLWGSPCARVQLQWSCKVTYPKSHFSKGVLLWVCCIFSDRASRIRNLGKRFPMHLTFLWTRLCTSHFVHLKVIRARVYTNVYLTMHVLQR